MSGQLLSRHQMAKFSGKSHQFSRPDHAAIYSWGLDLVFSAVSTTLAIATVAPNIEGDI